jgi:glycosyltransferase involved in cell wall biosynthesis
MLDFGKNLSQKTSGAMRGRLPKLIYFVAVDWFFCSHFIDRAKAAQRAGFDVVVLTTIDRYRAEIESAGFRVIELKIDRKSLSLVSAFQAIAKLIHIFRKERPEILHQVAIKPILLGGFAARITKVGKVVNAMVGGGYAFTSKSPLMLLLRPFIKLALRLLLNPSNSRVIFENKDDLASFVSARSVRPEAAVLIRGAGVNVEFYSPRLSSNDIPLIVVPARLLWDKGLGEFVAGARLLRSKGVVARFAVVGGEDVGNRASIPSAVLEQWRTDGDVELWGFRSNMPEVFAEADIVCLPSYREGLPKALLEGMAAGLPCVTTDVPGCREAVRDGENGLLVPPRDHEALAKALDRLIQDSELRTQMGICGRNMAITEFATQIVCQQTLQVYEDLLQS